jgi:hypothetical protein
MKKCSKCDEVKELDEFQRRKDSKDGYRNQCKSCIGLMNINNKKVGVLEITCCSCSVTKQVSEFYKDKYHSTGFRKECKICGMLKAKAYKKKNPEKIKNIWKKWSADNKDKIKLREAKRRENTTYRLKSNISRRIRSVLSGTKSKSTEEILGCSARELRIHLERTFEENYGMPREWLPSFNIHIDHIIPIKSATSEEEIYKLNHYSNLQLLIGEDNIRKHARLDWSIEEI